MKKALSFPLFVVLLAVALAQHRLPAASEQPAAASETPLQEDTGRPSIRRPLAQNSDRNGKIATLVGRILEQLHYIQQPYNDEMSGRHLHNYIDALDYAHMVFNQEDVDQFVAKYNRTLDDATARSDTNPAFEIFERFVQRLEQRKTLVERLVEEKYDFTVDEKFLLDRDKEPFPASDADAEKLWRSRVKYELLQARLNGESEHQARNRVKKRYATLLKNIREYEESEVLEAYLNALTQAYDPHSDYLTPEAAENFDISAIDLKLTGIGAVLTTQDGYAKIQRLVPGGPAALSKKLKPGDRIVAVAQGEKGEPVDVVDMKLRKVVDLIRGPENSKVRLTVIPADSPDASIRQEVVMTRAEIVLTDSFAKARLFEIQDAKGEVRRVGVIELPQFYKETTEHVSKLIRELKKHKVEGIVLDLRKNGGGLLDQAIELTGLFIKSGPVVQVKNHEGRTLVLNDEDNGSMLYDGPMSVLVGHLSASASEIVAAALQDYDRAVVVGDSMTHGKGTVQTLLALNKWMGFGFRGDPGKLKLTVQKFYRVSGGSTQQKGVIPDLQLPSLLDYYEIGERQLPNHLAYDKVEPARFPSYRLASQFVPELKAKSEQRVRQSKDFAYVFEDIEILKHRLEDKSVSLNEAKLKKEKEDTLARKETRNKEREARVPTDLVVYEITTEMVDKGEAPKKLDLTIKPKDKPALAASTVPTGPPIPAAVTQSEATALDGPSLTQAETKPGEAPAKPDAPADDDEEMLSEDDGNLDAQLRETIQIMMDYIDLADNRASVATKSDN
jgi:carboxyl-terminal processing protease